MELANFHNGRVRIRVGDITKEDAEAIVNAANGTLLGGRFIVPAARGFSRSAGRFAGNATRTVCRPGKR
jgi:hypothetical protein